MDANASGHDDAFIVLDAKVAHNEFTSLEGVFPHIETEGGLDVEFLVQKDRVETHVFVNEVFELIGRDFTKALESGDFSVGGGVDGVDAFLVGVAVGGFLLVAYAEERRLKDVDMPGLDQFGIETQEEGQ